MLTVIRHESILEIVVEDNGIGMEPELQLTVFDLFTQASRTSDRALGGLGIGLALVRSLVELHGGQVSCFSQGANQGSQFHVSLPRARYEPEAQAASTQASPLELSARSILIVDDNQDAATMLKCLLESFGHDVRIAFNARDALDEIRDSRPDFAVLDIGLPEIDGNELALMIRSDHGRDDITLIALTGYSQAADRDRALAAGFDHYLVKPVDLDALGKLLGTGRI